MSAAAWVIFGIGAAVLLVAVEGMKSAYREQVRFERKEGKPPVAK